MKKYNIFKKEKGGKEVLVEVLLIVIALSMVMLFKTQIIGLLNKIIGGKNNPAPPDDSGGTAGPPSLEEITGEEGQQ